LISAAADRKIRACCSSRFATGLKLHNQASKCRTYFDSKRRVGEYAPYNEVVVLAATRFLCQEAAEVLGGFAAMHGLAQLVLEGKALVFFKKTDVKKFLKVDLPRILKVIYP
jgi:hypothetical protein